MVTYAALTWWPKTQEKKTQRLLEKVTRMVFLGITGAMKTCPTAALGAMLNMPPLHVEVKKKAASSALRLAATNNFKPGDLTGHLSILQEFQNESLFRITDSMPIIYNFDCRFKVSIEDRQKWHSEEFNPQTGSQLWYTDGSKIEGGATGAGVYGPRCRRAAALGKSPSVFQAEVYAIETCV